MLTSIYKVWNTFFFSERSAVGLSLFRCACAAGIGFHMIPTLIHADDNYLHTGYREPYESVFPDVISFPISHSSDTVVYFFMFTFFVSWFSFLIGFRSKISCIIMTLSCLYFSALSALFLRTLAFRFLFLNLFIMCFTDSYSDHFSLDALIRSKHGKTFPPVRLFTVQRLLQLNLSWVYFYSGLAKIYPGNWLTENPVYYLLNYPEGSVVKDFWLREFFAASPAICKALGVGVFSVEILLSLFLFIPRTRFACIVLGILYHLTLQMTMHIPNIFIIIFPAQLLLFIPPEQLSFTKMPRPGNHVPL